MQLLSTEWLSPATVRTLMPPLEIQSMWRLLLTPHPSLSLSLSHTHTHTQTHPLHSSHTHFHSHSHSVGLLHFPNNKKFVYVHDKNMCSIHACVQYVYVGIHNTFMSCMKGNGLVYIITYIQHAYSRHLRATCIQ